MGKLSRIDQERFVEGNLWKLDLILFMKDRTISICWRLFSTNFSWSIPEYLVSYVYYPYKCFLRMLFCNYFCVLSNYCSCFVWLEEIFFFLYFLLLNFMCFQKNVFACFIMLSFFIMILNFNWKTIFTKLTLTV